jgi:hypothetical protein
MAPVCFGFEVASSIGTKLSRTKKYQEGCQNKGRGQRKREGAASPPGVEFDENGGGTEGFSGEESERPSGALSGEKGRRRMRGLGDL